MAVLECNDCGRRRNTSLACDGIKIADFDEYIEDMRELMEVFLSDATSPSRRRGLINRLRDKYPECNSNEATEATRRIAWHSGSVFRCDRCHNGTRDTVLCEATYYGAYHEFLMKLMDFNAQMGGRLWDDYDLNQINSVMNLTNAGRDYIMKFYGQKCGSTDFTRN